MKYKDDVHVSFNLVSDSIECFLQTRDSRVGYAFVMCTATHLSDHGKMCEDQGNLNNDVNTKI